MHKVFISYHHDNDQEYKNHLVWMNRQHNIFIDKSVKTNDISDDQSTQTIRQTIRDNYLQDSTVTILLVGTETRYRKHIDWELKSSMINGSVNKKSGILIITLPSLHSNYLTVAHPGEKEKIYPEVHAWTNIETKSVEMSKYPAIPERIMDNIVNPKARISIVPWDRIKNNPQKLTWLIKATSESRDTNEYDLSRRMRMRDHNPYL
ncbi:MAG: TIR domain-containing protein [Robiginitomaculum sp.]|nr:TIR domain-containing protein [Robiginitomaculum sp.]